jgi:putative Holliday junction resolvase
MRIMGIDYGRSRIGLSLSDPTGTVAQPLDILSRGPKTSDEIAKLATANGVEMIVVGLPLNMNGGEGEMARETRDFARKLHQATGLPVEMSDERLTSWEAHEIMKEAGLTRKKRSRLADKLAAVLILQRYLDRRYAPGN